MDYAGPVHIDRLHMPLRTLWRTVRHAGFLTIFSFTVEAMVWQEWQVHVTSTPAEVGGPALLTCATPTAVRDHSSVAAWYRDDAVLSAGDHYSGPTLLVDEGWKLIVRSVRVEDSRAQYSCSVLDSLTGERRRSPPISIDVAPAESVWCKCIITSIRILHNKQILGNVGYIAEDLHARFAPKPEYPQEMLTLQ
ncbi:jg4796 [Pararge aegeria aegeria]|uniref:Jg4796 protein n=1 Tax=Pararge aegeria aegeria TaxID=348720 RepID=A0A8S4R4C4_9NEOP|nr:jg4796 [Pararge aegeria aegeria]